MFGFKKKPENDINQYFVLLARNSGNYAALSVLRTEDWFHPVNDEMMYPITVKKAVKFAKKNGNQIWVHPRECGQDIIQYFEENVPHELWVWSPLALDVIG